MRCPKLTIKKNSCTNKKTATITENWAKGPNRRFTERRSKEAATKYSDIEATSNHRNTNQSIVISPCAHSIGKGQTFGNARCRRARGRVAGWSSPGASPGTAQLGLHPPPPQSGRDTAECAPWWARGWSPSTLPCDGIAPPQPAARQLATRPHPIRTGLVQGTCLSLWGMKAGGGNAETTNVLVCFCLYLLHTNHPSEEEHALC